MRDFLCLGMCLAILFGGIYFHFADEKPWFAEFSAMKNFAMIKDESEGFAFSGRQYRALVLIKNSRFIEDFREFTAQNADDDAYVATEFFVKDAQDFSAPKNFNFTNKSKRFSGRNGRYSFRVLLSEDEKIAYVHVYWD